MKFFNRRHSYSKLASDILPIIDRSLLAGARELFRITFNFAVLEFWGFQAIKLLPSKQSYFCILFVKYSSFRYTGGLRSVETS